ncbi:Kelch repeat-containing protein [candidate division KSB1 bacterium]
MQLQIAYYLERSCKLRSAGTQKADFGGQTRDHAFAFSINGKGYIGAGLDGSTTKKDFWEYDPATNNWTQKADFPGDARRAATGFAIGNYGYLGLGWDGTNYFVDFYEYSPGNNSWIQIANFGGAGIARPVGFELNGKGYAGTGISSAGIKQLWIMKQ